MIIRQEQKLLPFMPSLIRHGRCFDVLHLQPLEVNDAAMVRTALGKEPVVFEPGQKFTLSQAIYYDQIQTKDHSTRQAMGFNPVSD